MCSVQPCLQRCVPALSFRQRRPQIRNRCLERCNPLCGGFSRGNSAAAANSQLCTCCRSCSKRFLLNSLCSGDACIGSRCCSISLYRRQLKRRRGSSDSLQGAANELIYASSLRVAGSPVSADYRLHASPVERQGFRPLLLGSQKLRVA